ncbi:hypothetical protein BKA56DRAFT_678544 [Ilyonectria sp. MPI-CAGE-AT-0026]|nr:hypothetical protein BKA56DRAFT_678544 [Ilyonectria sp. MPI-CAGE-AT-0026]
MFPRRLGWGYILMVVATASQSSLLLRTSDWGKLDITALFVARGWRRLTRVSLSLVPGRPTAAATRSHRYVGTHVDVAFLGHVLDAVEAIGGGVGTRVVAIDLIVLAVMHLSTGDSLSAEALHCSTGWRHEPPINVSPPSLVSDLGLPHPVSDIPTELAAKADDDILTRFPILKDQPDVTPKRKTKKEA